MNHTVEGKIHSFRSNKWIEYFYIYHTLGRFRNSITTMRNKTNKYFNGEIGSSWWCPYRCNIKIMSYQVQLCDTNKCHLHWKKKLSHFDLKSWVTGGTKIWPGIPSNWRIFESNWLDINWESIWLDIIWESIWLKY